MNHEAGPRIVVTAAAAGLGRVIAESFLAVGARVALCDLPGPALAEAIFAFARQQLAPYKRVRRIEFVSELPQTISGKIRRVQWRAQEVERQAAGARGAGEFLERDFPNLRLDD